MEHPHKIESGFSDIYEKFYADLQEHPVFREQVVQNSELSETEKRGIASLIFSRKTPDKDLDEQTIKELIASVTDNPIDKVLDRNGTGRIHQKVGPASSSNSSSQEGPHGGGSFEEESASEIFGGRKKGDY